jgi:hypothetical protein
MCGENHFSFSPHGQAIRRSPLLAKRLCFALFPFDVRCWAFGVRCSTPQGVVDSDPPCPWRANGWRESLLIVLAWSGDSEITSPCEEALLRAFSLRRSMLGVRCSTFIAPRSGGLRSAMPMRSQWVARITSHCPRMGRRFGDHLSLRRGTSHSFIRRSMLKFSVRCPLTRLCYENRRSTHRAS